MPKVTMSLYKALIKKKIYEEKINKIQSRYTSDNNKDDNILDVKAQKSYESDTDKAVCAIKYKYRDAMIGFSSIDDANKTIQKNYDSTVSIINNYIALKLAINNANATSIITVDGKEYTIANAIVRQRYLDLEERIYKNMQMSIIKTKREIEECNESAFRSDNVADYVSVILGDCDKNSELIESTILNYHKNNEVELYDPMHIEELVTKKLDEIAKFRESIHFALTEANCRIMIDVDLSD